MQKEDCNLFHVLTPPKKVWLYKESRQRSLRSVKYEPEIIFVDEKRRNNIKALFGTGSLSEVYNF